MIKRGQAWGWLGVGDVLEGQSGQLVLSGWIGVTPDGRETGYLLATTPDRRALETMPLVAEALGLSGAAGTMSPAPTGGLHVELAADGWASLVLPGIDRWSRPVGPEWSAAARDYGAVVLTIGFAPMPVAVDPMAYLDRVTESDQYVLALVPVSTDGARRVPAAPDRPS